MWRMLCDRAQDLEVTLVEHEAGDDRGSAHWLADYVLHRLSPVKTSAPSCASRTG